jgi:hypothetical protein
MITYIKKAIWMHFYICTQKTRVLFSPFYSLFYSLLELSTSRGGQSQFDDFLYIKWIFFPTAFTKAFGSFHLPEPLGNAMGMILTNEK